MTWTSTRAAATALVCATSDKPPREEVLSTFVSAPRPSSRLPVGRPPIQERSGQTIPMDVARAVAPEQDAVHGRTQRPPVLRRDPALRALDPGDSAAARRCPR